jgi:hypothetical protein
MREPGAGQGGAVESIRVQLAAMAVWLLIVGGALVYLWAYKLTPGRPATYVASWPAGTSIARDPDRPTLLVFVHPRCPCTRATLATLRIVLSRAGTRVRPYVVFRGGEGDLAGWRQSDIWQAAGELPVTILADADGAEAARFGATTSGQVSLYGADGRLEFEGGITPGRGHSGDNPQLDRLLALVDRPVPARADARPGAVYGCDLRDPPERP